MSWTLVLVVLVLLFIVVGFKVFETRRSPPTSRSTYRKLEALLTPAERSFFGVLHSVIGDRLQIFAKVRVADVLAPAKGLPNGDRQRAFNRISAKHFDFVLCKPDDLSVVCGLELDDKSHETKKRIERDELLHNACDSAGLPLVRFKAKSAYTRADIEEGLADYLPKSIESPVADAPPRIDKTSGVEVQSLNSEPQVEQCPTCGSNLVKRVAKKGKHEGREFMACSSFPKCRYVADQ
jgi:hypothetical protein